MKKLNFMYFKIYQFHNLTIIAFSHNKTIKEIEYEIVNNK
jgi:hypothetical protein